MSLCPYPTIRFIAYGARDPHKIFVPDPTMRGRYVYTDPCVAKVACPVCKSIPGEPCKRHYGPSISYHSGTHADRRGLMKRNYGIRLAEDVIKPHIKLKVIP